MQATAEIIHRCRMLVTDPDARQACLAQIRPNHAGLSGCISNYVPEEIVAAAGFHPVRCIGSFRAVRQDHAALFNPVCAFVQDFHAFARSGGIDCLDHVIFPNSCDSLRLLREVWSTAVAKPFHTLLHPVKQDDDAVLYFAQELRRFAEDLAAESGRPVTRQSLAAEIRKYNETRGLLRRMYAVRRASRDFMKYSDLSALLTAGLIMDRAEFNGLLRAVLDSPENAAADNGAKNIIVAGPLMDDLGLLERIEGAGGRIVGDMLTNGWRYCDLDVDADGDLFENLARRYLRACPGPTLAVNNPREYFFDLAGQLQLHGVIFLVQKFCDPHIYNYLAWKDILAERGIPHLLIEIDHAAAAPAERELLRIESFMEL